MRLGSPGRAFALGGLAFALLLAAPALADEPTGRVSIQVQSPPVGESLKIVLDDRELPLAPLPPAPEPSVGQWPPPQIVGTLDFDLGSRHRLLVEAPAQRQRAQLIFTVEKKVQWIVIHYYAGRAGPWESPMLTFSLQDAPYAAK